MCWYKSLYSGNTGIGALQLAFKAAKALKASWSAPMPVFPEYKDLYQHMRSAPPKASRETRKDGDAGAALAGAAKKVQATYEFPFQSHAPMGPGCGVADVKSDSVTIWSGTQKPHGLRTGI